MSGLSERLDEGFFRSAIESSVDCIKVLDLEGRVQFVNAAGLSVLGVQDISTLQSKPWTSIWPEPAASKITQALAAAKRGEHFRFEAQAPFGRGVVKNWDVIVSPLRDREGRVEGLLCTCRDVTEAFLGRLDTHLRSRGQAKTESAFRSANRVAQLGGWEFDCATRQVVFSSELADLLGGSAAPMDYADALNFWVDEDRAAFADQIQQASAFGREFTFEGRFRGPDGSVRWMRVIGEPELADGWCVALRGASQDITEWRSSMDRLRESEQTALKATEAMSNFLTNMSHELRTPLNGVLGMAEVMACAPLSDIQRQRLGVIKMSGEALLAQLNDLLDLSKIAAGGMQLANEPIDLQNLAEGVQIFTALAQDKGLTLAVRLAPNAPIGWSGDPDRLRQVLHNLVANAVKFTDRGPVAVDISADADRLMLQVKDTGIGIPQDKQAQIFERFVQADQSSTRRHGGCGLGLAICSELVALMNGEINVQSEVGVGSTFTVSLPLTKLQSEPGAQPPAPASAVAGGLRVLAAEDNPTNQLVLQTLLGAMGIDPVVVSNGEEAVQVWKDGRWDVVLMDIQMPVMDGVSATRAIREIERSEGFSRTAIIAVTANAMTHHREEYLAAGMDEVVPKPINVATLIEAMNQASKRDDLPPASAAPDLPLAAGALSVA